MNNYTNNEVHDPNGLKEQVKIKYEATKAIVRRFPNGTATLMHLLSSAEPDALDWDGYCALPAETRLVWETRANALNQAMIFIMNSKNEITKKDLRLAYSQGNHTAYPTNIELAARYLATRYSNIKSGTQRKSNKEKRIIQNLKIWITQRVVPLGRKLRIVQQVKTPPLLAEKPA